MALISRPCYGYRPNNSGELVIHEQEAKIVRQISSWSKQGLSLRQISERLYEQGTPSPTGRPTWGTETLNKLLHNEKYTGNVMLQKTYVPDMLSGKQVQNTGQIDKVYIENTHEGII
ncbi:MAG: recombinase family protein [Candidatus Saccharimonadales bacterium]